MFSFLARLTGDAVAPLVGRATAFGASLLRKLALFLAAALCMLVVVIALTIAFDLWIASLAGPIVGALAVAGLYLAFAVVALALALRGGGASENVSDPAPDPADRASAAARNETIDRFTAPLLSFLASIGLRREQIAVLAGAGLAKRLGPVPLVGLAIVAGFLVGRLWRGWDALLSSDLVATVSDLVMPGRGGAATHDEPA